MRDQENREKPGEEKRDPGTVPPSVRNSIAYQRLNARQKALYRYFRRKAAEQEPPGYKPGVFVLDYADIARACGVYANGNIGKISKDITILTRNGFISCLHLAQTLGKLSCQWRQIGAVESTAGKEKHITGGTS